jgi:hypothetical protein
MNNRDRFFRHGGATKKRRTGNAYALIDGRYVPIQVEGTEREIARQVAKGLKERGAEAAALQMNPDGAIHVGVMPITEGPDG